jgi:hypothetical protein
MEKPMSIKTKIATLAIAALAVTSIAVGSASAKPKINPVAAGLVGAAIVGTTIIAASQPSYGYYPRHRHCFWKPVRNMFGQVIGHVRDCHVHAPY